MSTKFSWDTTRFICSLILISGLTACLGDDDDDKAQQVSVQGKVVKGTLANADVNLYAGGDMSTAVGSGMTDENGQFDISIPAASGDMAMVVKVTTNANTTMVCDADKCGSVNRGDTMTATELGGLELKSNFSLEQGASAVSDIPVNSLTSAATEVILSQVGSLENITPAALENLQKVATEVVMTSFGLSSDANTNLFDIEIPDASTLATALSSDSQSSFKSQLAMLNASFATETDITAEIEKFYMGISASLDNDGLTTDFSSYLSTLKARYDDLYSALNASGELPTGITIPDLAQFAWPDNITFEGDGIVIDPGVGGDGDWTLVVTGTSTVTSPVEVTVDIPSITIQNTTPPTNTDQIGSQFKEITEVEGVTVSDFSFEEVERTANKVVIKYSATISVSAGGVTSSQTQNLTYTWTK